MSHRVPRWRWAAEAAALVTIYTAYTLVRNHLGSYHVSYATAAANARDVLSLERVLHLDVEEGVQRLALHFHPIVHVAGIYYRTLHQWAVIAMLAYLLARRADRYDRLRTVLVAATVLALAGFALYPLAPPRLLPDLGFVDTVRLPEARWAAPPAVGSWHFDRMATNQFAAMPSVHLAFATWVLVAAWLTCGRRGRAAAIVHLGLTSIAVVATANHWVLDGVAGAAMVALGWVIAGGIHDRIGQRDRDDVSPRVARATP